MKRKKKLNGEKRKLLAIRVLHLAGRRRGRHFFKKKTNLIQGKQEQGCQESVGQRTLKDDDVVT